MTTNVSVNDTTTLLTLTTLATNPKVVTLPLASANSNRVLIIKDAFANANYSSIAVSTSSVDRMEFALSLSTTTYNVGNTSLMLIANPATNLYHMLTYYSGERNVSFNPAVDIPGCVNWWDFTDTTTFTTYTGGTPSALRVARVNDKANPTAFLSTYINGANTYQGPRLSTGGLFFDNNNDTNVNVSTKGLYYYNTATTNRNIFSSISCTCFYVSLCTLPGLITAAETGYATVVRLPSLGSGTATGLFWIMGEKRAKANDGSFDRQFTGGGFPIQNINFLNYFSSTKNLFTMTGDVLNSILYANGLLYSNRNVSLTINGLYAPMSNFPVTVCGHPDNRIYTGLIGEIIMYNGILNSNDRQKVEGYLAAKHGLQSSLPLGHPYKYVSVE